VRAGGIVRGMDAAPEAHKDVFTAFPPARTDPASRRSGTSQRDAESAYARFSISM
jgi:hypothetical protein